MSFLSPIFLWALPLLLIPVIIHLLAKRKSKILDFPSLRFLKLLEQDALKKFNLKQIILLIIRTLMVLLIILAFSRPSIQSTSGSGFSLRSTNLALILVDNSASTIDNFSVINGDWLDALVSGLQNKGYEVKFSDVCSFQIVDSRAAIFPSFGTPDYARALERIEKQIDLDRFVDKIVIYLGDGQGVTGLKRSFDAWELFQFSVPIAGDLGITDLELPEYGLASGQEFTAGIRIASNSESRAQIAQLYLNDERVNQTVVEPGSEFLEMSAIVNNPGFQTGRVELGEDLLPYNNMRYFVLPALGDKLVQILRVSRTVDYWQLMARSLSLLDLNLDIRVINTSETDRLDLSQGGTVILESSENIAKFTWDRLMEFVQRGGQLILFGNIPSALAESLNREIVGIPEVSDVDLLLNMTPAGEQEQSLHGFAAAVKDRRLKVFKRYNTGAMEMDHTWVRYADDQPFMGAYSLGYGRLIWVNTDFDTGITNLPILGAFPTLILRLGQTTFSSQPSSVFNQTIGDTLTFLPSASEQREPFSVLRPDGTTEYLTPDSSYTLNYSKLDIPGIYTVKQGRSLVHQFAVNISTGEGGAPAQMVADDGQSHYSSDDQEQFVREILESRTGMPLWPGLLLLLLLLWIIETYLSRIKSDWRGND